MTNVQAAIDFLKGIDHAPTIEDAVDPFWPEGELDVHAIAWDELFPPEKEFRRRKHFEGSKLGPDLFGDAPEDVNERFRRVLAEPNQKHEWSKRLESRPQWDHVAWYQPIHYHGHYWGIFIREEAIWDLALEILARMPQSLRKRWSLRQLQRMLWSTAFYAYFLHEQYHHKVESLGFRLAVVTRQVVYHQYRSKVYKRYLRTDDCLEEALANADMWRRLSDKPYSLWLTNPLVKLAQKVLKDNFPWELPGYRKAVDFLDRSAFAAGENLLQSQVRECVLHPSTWKNTYEWDLAPRMLQALYPVTSNVYTVVPAGTRTFGPTRHVSPVGTCSTDELVRLLLKWGYSLVPGGRGSHIKLEQTGRPTLTIPHDRDHVAPWIVKQALRGVGLGGLRDLDRLRNETPPAGGGAY